MLATFGVLTIGITGVIGTAPAQALLPAAIEAEAEVVPAAPEVEGLSEPDAAAAAAFSAPQPAAMAPAPASCQVNTVYALGKTRYDDDDDYKWEILAINHSSSTASVSSLATLSKNRVDGLGIVPGGSAAVYARNAKLSKGATPTLYKRDFATGRETTLSGVAKLAEAAPNGIQAGAVHPYNGLYYYGFPVVANNTMTWHIYAYDLKTNRGVGKVGYVSLLPGYGGADGDFAFGPQGELYLLNSAGSLGTSMAIVPAEDVSSVASPNAHWRHQGRGVAGIDKPTGAAWLAGNDHAPLGLMAESKRDAVLSARTLAQGNQAYVKSSTNRAMHVTDLANCAPLNNGLEVATNITSRINTGDQFTVSATGATPVTTAGAANGQQPVKVVNRTPAAGQTMAVNVDFKRSGHSEEYSASLACVVSDTNVPIETTKTGEGSFTFPYPPASGSRVPAVHCDVTVGAPASIQVTKELPAGRAWASDQFSVTLKADEKPVIAAGAKALSEGTGTRVNAGTGTSGKILAKAGVTYSFSESAAATVQTSNYQSTVSCADPTGIQKNLPVGQALPIGSAFSLKVSDGAQVSCVITNTSTGATPAGGFTCEAGAVYGVVNEQLSNNGFNAASSKIVKIYTDLRDANSSNSYYAAEDVSGDLHQTIPKGTRANSLAISQGGMSSYFVGQNEFNIRNSVSGLYVLDNTSPTGKPKKLTDFKLPVTAANGSFVRGGINPTDGMYWASGSVTLGEGLKQTFRHHFWAFDTLTGTDYGYVGYLDSGVANGWLMMNGSNGDLVFDQDGNMLMLTATGSVTDMVRIKNLSKGIAQIGGRKSEVDLSSRHGVTATPLMTPKSLPQSNGITFDNDGYLWTSRSADLKYGYLNRVDPNTGELVDGLATTQGGGRVLAQDSKGRYTKDVYISDLADCNDPGGLQVVKNIGDRADGGDQFQLEVFRSSFPAGVEKTQTRGETTGVQSDAIAGPIVGIPGQAYTVRESNLRGNAGLGAYGTTLQCVDVSNRNAPVQAAMSPGKQGEYTLTFPGLGAPANAPLPNVECTFTNSPKATLAVNKALSDTRISASDQFTVQILANGSVVKASTTTGAGKTIAKGSGDTGAVAVAPNTEYVITEVGAAGTNLANYPGAMLTCVDPTGHHQKLPVNQPLDAAGFAITPAPMSKVSCTITNTPGEAELATKKTLLTVTDAKGTETPVTKDTHVSPGDVLKYQIETSNRGALAGSTVLTELVPAGTKYTGKNEGWSCDTSGKRATSGEALECKRDVKNLAPGATDTVTFTVTVDDAAALQNDGDPISEIHNIVTTSEGVCEPGDCEVTTPLRASWTVEKTAFVGETERRDGFVRAGDTITYVVTAKGLLGESLDIVLTDDLAGVQEHTEFVKNSVTWEAHGDTAVLADPAEASIATPSVALHAGETAKLSYTVKVKADAHLERIQNVVTGAGKVEPDQCITGKPYSVTDQCVTTHTTGAKVIVEKLEENGDALPGADFIVSSDDGGKPGEPLTPNLTNLPGENGGPGHVFEIAGLQPGSYWLTETKAPVAQEGKQPYQLLAQPIRFIVQADGNVILSQETPLVAESEVIAEGLVIKVFNRPGFVLPNSGGLGTAAYTAIGVAILSVAMFALLRRRRAEAVVSEDD